MDIDVTVSNKRETVCYRYTEIQTDITFSVNTLYSLYTPFGTNAKTPTVITSTHSLSSPFR